MICQFQRKEREREELGFKPAFVDFDFGEKMGCGAEGGGSGVEAAAADEGLDGVRPGVAGFGAEELGRKLPPVLIFKWESPGLEGTSFLWGGRSFWEERSSRRDKTVVNCAPGESKIDFRSRKVRSL